MADEFAETLGITVIIVIVVLILVGAGAGLHSALGGDPAKEEYEDHRLCNTRGMFLARREGSVVLCRPRGRSSPGNLVAVPFTRDDFGVQ